MFLEIWNFISGSGALLLTFLIVAIVDNFHLKPSVSVLVSMLLCPIIMGVLILAPPASGWRRLPKFGSSAQSWQNLAWALLAPFTTAYAFAVILWLGRYDGRCGDWISAGFGRTFPCAGFLQYFGEALNHAFSILVFPGLLGIGLGLAVLAVGLIRRAMTPPAG
jgi:hypothetical protein